MKPQSAGVNLEIGTRANNSVIHHIRTSLCAVLPLLFLVATYLTLDKLMTVTIIVMAIVLILSLPKATGSSRILGYCLISLSVLILVYSGSELQHWGEGIAKNIDLVSLFLTVPFLSMPLIYGNYLSSVERLFIIKVKKNYQVYCFSMIISFLMGAVFNLATMHIIYQLFCQNGSKERKELILLAAHRGFTACIFWSPTFFSVGLVLSMTGVRWIEMFPYGFTISLAILVLGLIIDVIDKRRKDFPEVMETKMDLEDSQTQYEEVNYKKIWELLLIGFLVLITTILLNTLYGISILVLVPTVAISFPLVWLIFLKKITVLPTIFRMYYQVELPKHHNEIVLFTSIGLLSSALSYSEVGLYMVAALEKLVAYDSFITMMVISLAIAILFVIGISPIITITLFVASLQMFSVIWDPLFLALGLIIGWALGIVLAPFAALNLVVGIFLNKTPFEVGIKNNWLYATLMFPIIWGLMAIFFKY